MNSCKYDGQIEHTTLTEEFNQLANNWLVAAKRS